MIDSLLELVRNHRSASWVLVLSVLMFFGSVVFAWWVIVRLPADYLTNDTPPNRSTRMAHPVLWVIGRIGKTLLGLLLVVAGFIMLFVPGQGLLFIFLGITMLEFPGKQRLIRRMLQGEKMLKVINGIRKKAHRPPLETAH